ncbi:MAG: hypothetical protein GWP58_09460 [Gammaproteobacteria bacterium]|nr:hypothetical protein [Gammaproteobacteria bacterium]
MTEFADTRLAGRWQKLDKGQLVKWTIYSLLLVNWAYYAVEEFYIASHVLRNGGTFLQWTEEFATTIDEFAWFGLLFMFELETYSLDEALEKPWVKWSVHGMRLVCYVFLAHTVYARVNTMVDVNAVVPSTEITNLCQVAGQDISFGSNYRYEIVTAENCDTLSNGSVFYMLEPTVITDSNGFELEKKHVWVDFQDAVIWLLVVWAIELAVWLQNRDITGGALMVVSHGARVGYAVLLIHAAFWAWTGHWVWGWDQFLWIAGFWAIERNLSEWREEIRDEHPDATQSLVDDLAQ